VKMGAAGSDAAASAARRGEFGGCKLGGERVARGWRGRPTLTRPTVCCGVRANLMQLRSPRTVRLRPQSGQGRGKGVGGHASPPFVCCQCKVVRGSSAHK
jgi:hypothetical protein